MEISLQTWSKYLALQMYPSMFPTVKWDVHPLVVSPADVGLVHSTFRSFSLLRVLASALTLWPIHPGCIRSISMSSEEDEGSIRLPSLPEVRNDRNNTELSGEQQCDFTVTDNTYDLLLSTTYFSLR